MKVIISKYKEDISWVSELQHPYIIVDKGRTAKWSESAYEPPPKHKPVFFLPNCGGREMHTYLHYIYHYYNKLDNWTCFLQGNPFDHCKNVIKRVNTFNQYISPGYYPLTDMFVTETINQFCDMKNYLEFWDIDIKNKEFDTLKYIIFPQGGQMIVHKDIIHRLSREFYKKLYDMCCTDIQQEQSAHVIERILPYIFMNPNLPWPWVYKNGKFYELQYPQ